MFNKKGDPTKEFSHARNQLAQWRVWFGDSVNLSVVLRDYGASDFASWRSCEPHFILIYGRRDETADRPDRNKIRSTLLPGAYEELMSFDRLAPDPELYNAVTVRALGDGRYKALQVQPTLTLGPVLAQRLLRIEGLDDAIDHCRLMAPERRDFLKSRIGYWQDWAQSDGMKTIRSGDQE